VCVHKVLHRKGQDGAVPSGDAFYIIAGTVYKAPQVGDVFDTALYMVASALDVILERQTEGFAPKRRKLAKTSPAESAAKEFTTPGGSGADADLAPNWPVWCTFEKKTMPNAWGHEALRAGGPTAVSRREVSTPQ